MKRKLFNMSLWLIMVLFSINAFAQADPVFTSLNPNSQMVTITNSGDTMVDIGSYQLCTNGFRYDSVGSLTTESTMLAAGASITVTWNDIPTTGSGTLMLFTNSSFGSSNPDILRDYVRWGTGAGFRLAQGVNSGRWSRSTASVSFTCPPSDTSGVINTDGTRGGNPGAWGDADAGVISLDVNATNAAGGNTTSIDGEFEVSICVDGNPDPVVVNHVTDATRSYLYVITDNSPEETILNIVATNEISLDGAGPGTCLIWGWSYSGLGGQAGALATFGGGPLQALRDADCSDISQEFITVVREEADGGTVSIDLDATGNPNGTTSFNGDTEAVICLDSQADPIVVAHENPGAENLSYRYVITDAATGLILNVVNTNSIDLNGVAAGVCEIWGWSYRGVPGNGLDQVGQPLSALDNLDCSDISDNQVTVIREAADGGTVSIDLDATGNPNGTTSFNGDTEAVICLDSQADPIVVVHENDAPNLSYRYVITDAATGLILNVVNTNSIDLNGVAAGVCEIWGWSYRGVPGNGLDQVGQPLSALDNLDCSDISDNQVTVIREAADGGTVSIDLEATGNPNGTTSFNGDTEAVICLDSQADPIVVVHENDAPNLSYRYVITDAATGLILNVVNTNSIDLNGVAAGVCEIWGWSYRGVPGNGLDQVGQPLSALDNLDCSDISDNQVTVIREAADGGTVSIDLEATGNPNGTTSFNGDTEAVICLDSQADPIVVVHENDAPNLSYRYVITDAATGLILNVVNTNSIDLNGVAAGVCEIWGWSYRGVPGNGLDQVGQPLSALDDLDCSDISDNQVTVIREAADGGTVSIDLDATGNPNGTTTFNGDTEAVICLDTQMDPIVVVHENESPNLSYRYVITDAATGLILNVVATNSIDLNGVAAGVCEIWGWSYRGVPGNGLDQVGQPLSALDNLDCSDISDNQVTVIREAADGGTVSIDLEATGNPNGTTSFNGDTEAVICLDSQADPIVVVHENDAPNLSYRYVITDAATGLILNVVATNSIDLNGVAAGVCEIWGWSYRGVPGNGLDQIGEPLSALDDLDCSDISDNAVTVIREAADGGTVSIDLDATGNPNGTTSFNGDTEAVICLDTQMDPIVVVHENESPNLSYRYVITDAATGLILNVVATNSIDLNGVEAGVCEIWGWSYRGVPGNGLDQIGEPLSALDDLDCSDISDNAVTVIREAADGGTVSIDLDATGNPNGTTTFNGDTEAVICLDTQMDPIVVVHENESPNLSYRYVITDAATGLILNVVATNSIDLNGVAAGVCEIWGWSYRGVPGNGLDQIGEPLSALDDLDCSDISDNAVTVIREAADGGTVSIDLEATGNPNGTTTFNGDTEAVICLDTQMDPIVVVHENESPNLSYRYVITDAATGLILNVVATNSIDLNGVAAGVCEIWGWSYRGVPGNGLDQIGEPLSALDDLDCSDISDNAVTVIREAADGGTVSIDLEATGNPNGTTTFNGDTEAVICLDSQADPIVVVHENESPNLSYRYVITDAATGLILNVVNTNSIDLNGVAAGVCEIWGWSYRGVPGNGLDQIGEPLSALDDLDCSDISDNAVTVIREAADGGTVNVDIDATNEIGEDTTIVTGENSVTILVDDGVANPIVVAHENESPNLSYRYVITDAETGLILNVVNTNTIDLEGAGVGTCEIWGWSYRGVPGNGLDQIGEPLSALDDLDCSDISEDFIEVIRTDVLSVEDNQIDVELNMYPNPTTSFLNISLGGVNNGYAINVYSITGQVVMSESYTAQDNTLDVSRLSNGMYLLEVIDETSNTRTVKRFIKR